MAKKKKAPKKPKVRSAAKPKKSVAKKPVRRKAAPKSKAKQKQTIVKPRSVPMARAAAAGGSRGVPTRFADKSPVEPKEMDEGAEEILDLDLDASDDESAEIEIPPDFGGEN